MDENDIPVLGYAPSRPRSMRKKVLIAAVAAVAAGAAIVVGGTMYRASQARVVPLGGDIVDTQTQWQPTAPGAAAGGSGRSEGDPS